ncbi:MAG TPA: helicase-related protein [Patescibacteria group bacterium]|nr:helicase-related protein [Patescibacteria group bacterium]
MRPLRNHTIHRVFQRQKLSTLVWLTGQTRDQVIVGARSKHAVEAITKTLRQQGLSCDCLHPNRSSRQREKIFNAYENKQIQVLVSTHKYLISMPETRISRLIFVDLPHEHDYVRLLTMRPKRTIAFVTESDLTTLSKLEDIFERRLAESFVPRNLPHVRKPSRRKMTSRSFKRRSVETPLENTYPAPIYPIRDVIGTRRSTRASQTA